MKKNYGIDGLFSRPTGVNVEEEPVKENTDKETKALASEERRKVGRPKKPEGERETDRLTRVTFLANIDTITKVRAIASQEQLTIKDVIDTAMNEIIRRYEEKHGAIRIKGKTKVPGKTLLDVL